LEELQRCKEKLQQQRSRDGSEMSLNAPRSDTDKLTADNKRLIQQRTELLHVIKRQIKLIDVLKKQKVCEASIYPSYRVLTHCTVTDLRSTATDAPGGGAPAGIHRRGICSCHGLERRRLISGS